MPRDYDSHKVDASSSNHCCGAEWCVRDCCGITCAVVTWLLLLYGEFCVVTIMLWPSTGTSTHALHQALNGILFEVLFILAAAAHTRTMLTNPGTVPKGNATDDNIQRMALAPGQVVYKCAKCASIKPERAHHCSVCQRCIKKMDHHCPWVNNCVGECNQKYFVLFTLYISLLSAHAFYWGVWQFVTCVNGDWKGCSSFSPAATTILLIFLLFEALLFSIFTAVMFGTQVHAICTDETGIEQLKSETPTWDRKDRWKSLQIVMGGRFGVDWFNPFVAPYVSKRPFEITV